MDEIQRQMLSDNARFDRQDELRLKEMKEYLDEEIENDPPNEEAQFYNPNLGIPYDESNVETRWE